MAYMDPMGYVIYFLLISVYEKLSLWGITIHPIFSSTPKCRAANQWHAVNPLGGKVKIIDRKKNLVAVSADNYIPYIYPIYLAIYNSIRFYIPIPWLYYNIAITWVALESSLPLDSPIPWRFRVSRWSWKVANTLPWSWSMWPTTIMNSSTRMLEARVIIDSIDPIVWKHGWSAPISADQPKIHET